MRTIRLSWLGIALAILAASAPVAAQEEIPLADGDSWAASSQVEKTAYIVGANDLLVVEYITQKKNNVNLTMDESSVQGYWDGLEDVTVDELINAIDTFYQNNPDSMDTPVMVAIWNTYVEPEE